MRIKTFQGRTMEEVLPQIRDELGDDAVVLTQRQVINGGIGGFFGTRMLEVVASDTMPSDEELVELERRYVGSGDDAGDGSAAPVDDTSWQAGSDSSPSRSRARLDLTDGGDVALPDPVAAALAGDPANANRAAATNAAVQAMATPAGGEPAPDPSMGLAPLEIPDRSATVAVATPATSERSATAVRDAAIGSDPVRERASEALAAATRELNRQGAETGRPLVATTMDAADTGTEAIAEPADAPGQPVPHTADPAPAGPDHAPAMARVEPAPPHLPAPASRSGRLATRLRERLQEVEAEVAAAGVDPAIAQAITWHLLTHRMAFSPGGDVRSQARMALMDFLPAAGGWPAGTRQHRMAICGPSGVGKSTLVAKLAETYERQAGLHVGVVVVDPRAGSTGSLSLPRPLAERPHIDVRTVASTEQLQYVLERWTDADLVILDTPGSTYGDDADLQLVQACCAVAAVRDVHAVVPLATTEREAAAIIDRYAGLGVTAMDVTKVDESRYPGQLVNFGFRLRLPIRFLSDGPTVPRGITAASALSMAEMVLPYTSERG